MTTIALMGAGGQMGLRLAGKLQASPDYETFYLEVSEEGTKKLAALGLTVTPQEEVIENVDVVILAVPDRLIGAICRDIVPKVKTGAMVMGLDPAAGYAGQLPAREDISYFISHPCHAPMFGDESDPEAQQDFFGGEKAKQSIVCALHQGPEADYARGEAIARIIFAPILRTYRVTTEQMAILEPALVETLGLTFVWALKEALDEAVRLGVPEEVAREFLFGHVRCVMGEVFLLDGATLSEGARLAVSEAKKRIFQPDWLQVMSIESIQESVRKIADAPAR
jgi:pyrroline-5-carboxylate reductase